jgi:hypothetical protein
MKPITWEETSGDMRRHSGDIQETSEETSRRHARLLRTPRPAAQPGVSVIGWRNCARTVSGRIGTWM